MGTDDTDRDVYDLARDATDEASGGTAGGIGSVVESLARALEPQAIGLDRLRQRLDEQAARIDAVSDVAGEVLTTLRDVERHLSQVSATIATAAGILSSRPAQIAVVVLFVATSIGVASIVSSPPPIFVSWLESTP
jgi:methyl-accepting chemotaxis protein